MRLSNKRVIRSGRAFAVMALVGIATFTVAQRTVGQDLGSQLAQRIMLENNIRDQVETALSQAIGDEKFIVNVTATLNFVPAQRSSTVWEPTDKLKARSAEVSRKGDELLFPTDEFGKIAPPQQKLDYILPGFPELPTDSEKKNDIPAAIEKPAERESMPSKDTETVEAEPKTRLVRYSVERTTTSIPEIVNLAVTVMLEDGVSQDVLDVVRRIVPIAAGIVFERGDDFSIVTASFLEKKALAELAVEAGQDTTKELQVNLQKELAARMQQLEENQSQMEGLESTISKLPMYIVAIIGGLILLFILLIILLRILRPSPVYEAPGKGKEPKMKPAELAAAEEDARSAIQAAAARERAEALSQDMHKAELKNTRQAIITLSVGRPDTASKILSGWLEPSESGTGEVE